MRSVVNQIRLVLTVIFDAVRASEIEGANVANHEPCATFTSRVTELRSVAGPTEGSRLAILVPLHVHFDRWIGNAGFR